jgi:hypothetical protein
MSALDDWIETASAELGINPQELNEKIVMNLTRVVAHTVDRGAAPLTAYLLGLAVGRGAPLAETAAKLQDLARGRAAPKVVPEEGAAP